MSQLWLNCMLHSGLKVEQHRQKRTAFFLEIDREIEGNVFAVAKTGTSDPATLAVYLMTLDTNQLEALLDEGGFILLILKEYHIRTQALPPCSIFV